MITLSFFLAFSSYAAYAGGPDIHSDELIEEEEKDAAVDGMREEVFGDDEVNLEADQQLQEEAAELDENVEYEGEREKRKKESSTVYQYNKKLPKNTDDQIPRLWVVPK